MKDPEIIWLGGGLGVSLHRGAEVADSARGIWKMCDAAHRESVLWDAVWSRRGAALEASLRSASHVVLAWERGVIAGCAWFAALSRRGACASGHFLFVKRPLRALDIGRAALLLAPYACVIGLVPVPWRGARRYLADLGFAHVAILPGACYLATRRRLCAGWFMKWTRG